MKYQGNITQPKDRSNVPVTNPKEMEVCNFSNKELKVAILSKCNNLEENTEKTSQHNQENNTHTK